MVMQGFRIMLCRRLQAQQAGAGSTGQTCRRRRWSPAWPSAPPRQRGPPRRPTLARLKIAVHGFKSDAEQRPNFLPFAVGVCVELCCGGLVCQELYAQSIIFAPSLSSAASPFLRLFRPPPALPDTACLLRRRLPLAGGSSAASAPEPPSTISAGSAAAGDCLLLSGVGNTCVHAVNLHHYLYVDCCLQQASDELAGPAVTHP